MNVVKWSVLAYNLAAVFCPIPGSDRYRLVQTDRQQCVDAASLSLASVRDA